MQGIIRSAQGGGLAKQLELKIIFAATVLRTESLCACLHFGGYIF